MPETASSGANAVLAPGTRVLIRDAEWVIRRIDRSPDGGYQLVCDGVSELVREREAIFLSKLEQAITVLDPAETRLVPDPSPGFADSRLYIESQLRQAVPNDERIHVAHGAAMDPAPYQCEPARQALRQPRQRILIADAVGLGKTLEAGILASELMARGPGAPHPGVGRQQHAHAVPEGVLEPFHHFPHPARLDRHPAGAQPHPDQPQSVPLLRQGDHLDRHAEAGRGVPHLPGAGLLGRHRHRRGAQRGGPGCRGNESRGLARADVAAQPPGPPARPAVGHARHAVRDAP